jgi:ubiquinone/menaquinone biosynthesis C-methylase UbiE
MGPITNIHEKRVEKFYSTGLKRFGNEYVLLVKQVKGFLSFGYWNKDTKTYLEAAANLLNYFIKNSNIKEADRILNVAFGNGTETFSFFEKFNPKIIEGIDVAKVHVDCANNRAKALKLDKRIKFYHGDACVLNFPENTFSHILGIEGPAHFNTREKFFKSARRVLKKEGELILTDIILGEKFNKGKYFQTMISKLIAKKWIVPEVNKVNEERYKDQLKKTGLNVIFLKKIGNKVFTGYANNSLSIKTIKMRISQRGVLATIGLTIISYALGYLYKKGLIEYIFIKAKK